jgi:hypothetical protein
VNRLTRLVAVLALAVSATFVAACTPGEVSCVRTLAVSDVAQPEGSSTATPTAYTHFIFTVTSSGCSLAAGRVHYGTEDVTAVAGKDFIDQSGTLVFTSGDMSAKTIDVRVYPDLRPEPDETFVVGLCVPLPLGQVGATPETGTIDIGRTGTGTILDDDGSSRGSPTPLPTKPKELHCSE